MTKIAVIGLSCLFPGASTPEQFWQNLVDQRDSKSLATDEDMGADALAFFDPRKGRDDSYYSLQGAYIRDFAFDASGFRLAPDYLRGLDQGVQWSLYTAREALKDSGYWDRLDALATCGVVLGNLSCPTRSSNRLILPIYRDALDPPLRALLGDEHFHLAPVAPPQTTTSSDAARISALPAAVVAAALALSPHFFALDAACASSLYSVKLACDYLRAGKVDLMLAGAVNATDPFFIQMGFSILQALPEGKAPSAPLDRNTAGLVAGEGAGMLVLKRYDDAVRDGDRIHAVILGIGLANDGRGQSVLSPNPKGQILAFERAYAEAGISPARVSYVECHATGTALGDKVELNSMDAFFGRYGASPLVGSVKSNLGHLLTASGMPSMVKVILSMARGIVPPTINVAAPQSSAHQVITPSQVVTSPIPWPGDPTVRVGAVNAFGLGGTDAHIIFGRGDSTAPGVTGPAGTPAPRQSRRPAGQPSSMAIVGMDAHFGPCQGLRDFHRTTYEGTQHFGPLPPDRWKGVDGLPELLRRFGIADGHAPGGAYVDRFDLDFLRCKIPPNEEDRLIPQQLLALKVADNALSDAGITPEGNVAVVIAMDMDLTLHLFRGRINLSTQLRDSLAHRPRGLSAEQHAELRDIARDSLIHAVHTNHFTSFIGNIMASRVSALWDFSGPSLTVSAEDSSVFKALEIARMMLDNGDAQAVVVGAVDLAGNLESVLSRTRLNALNDGPHTLAFDQRVTGWTVGEGAGAVVLKRLDKAIEDGDRVYAAIDAMGCAMGTSPESVRSACQRAFESGEVTPSAVAYLEVSGSGIAAEDEAEISGLIGAYRAAGLDRSCAIGSVKANIGHAFAASGMASLIKTALCLHHRYIPGTPNWSAPKLPDLWLSSIFYVPTESRTWFLNPHHAKRIAAISALGSDGTSSHLILSEGPAPERRDRNYLADTPPFLFPVAGDDRPALRAAIEALRREARGAPSLPALSSACLDRQPPAPRAPYGLAIVASTAEELLLELDAADSAIDACFAGTRIWSSPRGSFFTANPLAARGTVAFVYPGGFSAYPGVGRDLFHLFPQVFSATGPSPFRREHMPGERQLYPRSVSRLSSREVKALEDDLIDTPMAMFESGVLFAILSTDIMRGSFGVEPALALGYSMGEVSMMFALGVWANADGIGEALRASPLFHSRLAGPMDTVREAWQLPAAQDASERIWWSYTLRTSPSEARHALANESRAFLIFVNSPEEVVIAGEAQACRRVIGRLNCEAFDLPMSDVMHCEIVRPEYDRLVAMHTFPVRPVPSIAFYSANGFSRLPLDSDRLAHNVATLYCHHIDFRTLVERTYTDGARIFLEMGPREHCARWITETLGSRDHLAISVNRKGASDKASLVRVLASLYSNRVDLDLSPLSTTSLLVPSPTRTLMKSTRLGGTQIVSSILSDRNRRRFLPSATRPAPDRLPGPAPRHSHHPAEDTDVPPRASERPPLSDTPAPHHGAPAPAQAIDLNLSLLTASQSTFLRDRGDALAHIAAVIRAQMATIAAQEAPTSAPPPVRSPSTSPAGTPAPARAAAPSADPSAPKPIWDTPDLVEFATGRLARVFGSEFALIDTYRRRVRLPSDPYLLVTRVTRLNAEPNVLKPCTITTEYDVPRDAWYSVDGQVPWAIAVEAGQCDLVLISYMGVDFECKGDRVYRLLDCTMTFLSDLPREGDTLRYDIRIKSFVRAGPTLIFFFEYDCFRGDQLVLQMRDACAGFFTDDELDAGKGIILTEQDLHERARVTRARFEPPLSCARSSFDGADLLHLVRNDLAACFGSSYQQGPRNASLRFTADAMRMIDRVVSVDRTGGPWGLGHVVAEQHLAPDDWYFPCHFKDDQVLAGSLMVDACSQLLKFYTLYLGLHSHTMDARFQPILGLPQKIRCRGQVVPADPVLTYRMDVKAIGTAPEPYAVADVDILLGDKIVVQFTDVGVRLSEKQHGA